MIQSSTHEMRIRASYEDEANANIVTATMLRQAANEIDRLRIAITDHVRTIAMLRANICQECAVMAAGKKEEK